MNYVIIGNSVAAVGAMRAIRTLDSEGSITVISRERYQAYGRPLISYLLGGLINEKRMAYLPADFCTKNRINLLLETEATGVDTVNRLVNLKGCDPVPYDRLLIATGGDPFVPPIAGLAGKERVFTFTTWDDAARLKAIAADIDHAVVIGGGLIGLKAAEGLHLLGKKVTIVELADRVLSAAFDKPAGRIIARKMKANGIDVITEDTVTAINGQDGAITAVTLKSGDVIPCDTVVVAIGVRPAASFLAGSDIEIGRGIIVDDRMQTSVKGVYAAGDVAEASDFFTGQKNPMPIWPDAYIQGDVAGTEMAGGDKHYAGGLAMNSIEFFKVPTISMGITNPAADGGFEVLTFQEPENYCYRKIVLQDNRLVGAVLVGNVDRAGIYSGLIREKMTVTPFKDELLASNFGFVNIPRELRDNLFAPQRKQQF